LEEDTMPEVTKHEHGSFSWAELATSDRKSAKSFYESLFGWTSEDNPIGSGPDDVYTRFQIGGKDVGAGYQEKGVPPHWNTYFTVSNTDETAKKVKAAGGTILKEPFDVMDYGRMAVVQGPEGAAFCLWQAGTHNGFQRINENNTTGWTELQTTDAAKSGKFLVDAIGFTVKTDPSGAYAELQRGGTSIGGIRPMGPSEPFPPHWLIYFQVADCDATLAKAKSLGASVLMPAMEVEHVGRFAVLADPQGAAFAVIKLAPM
jgi:predicted enzyme related to lactoylglutathione lyase